MKKLGVSMLADVGLLNSSIGPNYATRMGRIPVIHKWHVKEGEFIKEGDPVFQIKANASPKMDYLGPDILSPVSGTVVKIIQNSDHQSIELDEALYEIETEQAISRCSERIMLKDVYHNVQKNKFSWFISKYKILLLLTCVITIILLVQSQ